MDEGPIVHPGVPEEVYHTLGKKTFWIFMLQRIQASFVLLIVTVGLFVLSTQPFLVKTPAGNLMPYATLAAEIALLLFALAFAISFFVSWLIYENYKYCLGEDS